jgi:hypothetical protein
MSLKLENYYSNSFNYETKPIHNKTKNRNLIKVDNPSNSHFPGLSQLFFAPLTIIYTIPEFIRASSKGDMEGTLDAILRLSRANFSFAYAFMMASSYATQFFSLYEISFVKQIHTLSCPILGIVLSTLEMLYEGWSLIKIREFKNQFHVIDLSTSHKKASKSTKNKLLKKDIKFLNRQYLKVNSNEKVKIENYIQKKFKNEPYQWENKFNEISDTFLKIKKSDLARRVRPWLVEEIDQRLPKVLENIKDPNPEVRKKAIERAKELMTQLDTQCQKRILIHLLGLLALTFTMAAFILAIAGAPFLTVTLFFVVAAIIGFSRYTFAKGYLDSRGWKFRVENFPPEWVMKLYYKFYEMQQRKLLTSS